MENYKLQILLFAVFVLLSLPISFMISKEKTEQKIKLIPSDSIIISKTDGTSVDSEQIVRNFFDDENSNYCFELVNDTTFRLKCVCSCEEYKINESTN